MKISKKISVTGVIPAYLNTDAESLIKTTRDSIRTFLEREAEVDICFVSAKKMHALNNTYRHVDRPTDVLSFPLAQPEVKENGSTTSKKIIIMLGTIFICPSVVREKHEDVLDVIKHGLLHLLGYDHETNEQKWLAAAERINCHL